MDSYIARKYIRNRFLQNISTIVTVLLGDFIFIKLYIKIAVCLHCCINNVLSKQDTSVVS